MPATLNLSGDFYPAYKARNPTFSQDTFDCAEQTVAQLLQTATTSDHPGMLLGKVQSGKTRTFISILAVAFDNGYDIAIILSKNSKALIEQTTKRLHSEFADFVNDGEMEIYDIMHAPTSFEANELESKLIFVAKKQTDNLRRLIDLFTTNCPAMAKRRVLIIDDEADNASIGYTNKQGLIEANTIAAHISDLRMAIEQTSFLQVTATPYSLYLQTAEVDVSNRTSFSPTRPKFTELVPVPPEYVGGDTYFGEAARSATDTLQSLIHYSVDHREFDLLKLEDRRRFKLEDALTSSAIGGYRHALVTFIVGGCIQRINGIKAGQKPRKLKYSFLLHSEAGKDAHNWQETLTIELKNKLAESATNDHSSFAAVVQASYDDLCRSLALDAQPIPTFEEVLAAATAAVTDGQISIKKVNSDDDVAALLDNSGQLKLSNTFNIFIGGQVIDRGVTLASLIGFYYGRRPNRYQQDTVLQHSRMYGYRRPDLAVTRFYTSPAIAMPCSRWRSLTPPCVAPLRRPRQRAQMHPSSSLAVPLMAASSRAVRIKSSLLPRRHFVRLSAFYRWASRPFTAPASAGLARPLRRSMCVSWSCAASMRMLPRWCRSKSRWTFWRRSRPHWISQKTMHRPFPGMPQRRCCAISPSSIQTPPSEDKFCSGLRGIVNLPAWQHPDHTRPTSRRQTRRRPRVF